jgi:hypothetical protein
MRTAAALKRRVCRVVSIATVFASLSMADDARAQDQPSIVTAAPQTQTWVCIDRTWTPRDGRPPLELSLKDGLLIEQPLGAPRYRLIVNNAHAVIAIDDYADFDPALGQVSIFASTLVINKITGAFATTTTTLSEGAPNHRTGRCRMFDDGPAADRTLARRN